MPIEPQELKRHLMQTDPEFRELATLHHQLDERLHELEAKHYLTDSEQVEETTIKKRKLHLKDRMEDIARRYRHARQGAQPQA